MKDGIFRPPSKPKEKYKFNGGIYNQDNTMNNILRGLNKCTVDDLDESLRIFNEAQARLLEICPRLSSWGHRCQKSLRHPRTPEIVRGEIDAEDCKDISPQKKWNVLLEIFNVIMYSESFTRKRTIILENLEFCRIVTKWWLEMRNKDNVVEKKVYHLVHTRMYEELIGKSNEECTPVDYYEAIEDDWEVDRKGKNGVSFESFYGSFFELADNWTHTTEVYEYIIFLEHLYRRIFGKPIINYPERFRQVDKAEKQWRQEQIRHEQIRHHPHYDDNNSQ